jgi:hypothetical protein
MIAKIAEISKSENSPRRHGDTEKISGACRAKIAGSTILFTPKSFTSLKTDGAGFFTLASYSQPAACAPHPFINKKEAAFFCGLLVNQQLANLTNRLLACLR